MSQIPDKEGLRLSLPESLEVPPDVLQVRLDFYHDSVVMHLVEDGLTITRMVSASDVALAMLREVPLTSGLLPQNALWWCQSSNGPELALWRSPRVWPVALMAEPMKPPHRFRLPMPGLIFICRPGSPPMIFAAKERPQHLWDTLYHAPLLNIFPEGRSCAGSHKYPQNVDEIPESFFTSFFTLTGVDQNRSKKYPKNLLALWREIDGKKRYPMGDLVPYSQVADVISEP